MTRGGVSEETRTYCRKRGHAHILGISNRVRVTGHLQYNSSHPTQEASQPHSTAESCRWFRSLSMTLFPFAFLGANFPQANLRARTGNSHSLNHESCGFRKDLRLRGGVLSQPLQCSSHCCLWCSSTLSQCPVIQEGNAPVPSPMARPQHWLPTQPQVGQTDHLPCLLSQPCEADITEGIRRHFLDVPAGVPLLPQEDGRFGSIVQVLFPEIATLTNDPPEKHTNNFVENS